MEQIDTTNQWQHSFLHLAGLVPGGMLTAHFSSATSLGMPLLRLMVRIDAESDDKL